MPSHATARPDDRRIRDEAVSESLAISFGVVVLNVLRQGAPEMPLWSAIIPSVAPG
jgi:hypothetical protein